MEKKKLPGWKYIIAPHEIAPERIEKLAEDYNLTSIRYTELEKGRRASADILIIDTIGILKYLYRYCDIAYVGGGFGSGIHSVIEAAVYGKPLLFGANYHKFKEAVDLVDLQVAFCCKNQEELWQSFNFLNNPELYQQAVEKCLTYIHQNAGATDVIMEEILKAIKGIKGQKIENLSS